MKSTLSLAGALLLMVCLAGCGGAEDEPKSRPKLGAETCGVPTELVTAVIGTDDVEVRASDREFPVGADDDTGLVTCTVTAGEDRLSIRSTLSGGYAVAPALHRISGYDDTFEVNGAPAGLNPVGDDAFQATAACGMVVTQIEGSSPDGATDADRRALVEAVATKAGCARLPGVAQVATVADVTSSTATVCGAPGDLVRELAGRDSFYVMISGQALPLRSPAQELAGCTAYVAGQDKDVAPFFAVAASSAALARTRPAQLANPFPVPDARAATGGDSERLDGAVACRGLVVSASAPAAPSATAAMKRLLRSYAEAAGCGS